MNRNGSSFPVRFIKNIILYNLISIHGLTCKPF